MKVIQHFYSAETKWIDVLVNTLGGTIEGNFLVADNEIYCGRHYILEMEERIWGIVIDISYRDNLLLEYINKKNNFIGLYFYLTDKDVNFILDNESTILGKTDCNLIVIDGALDTRYAVTQGTEVYVICIFIDKELLQEFVEKIPRLKLASKDIFDEEKNTIISMGRMGIESIDLIRDFKKIPYDNALFELYFRALSYNLIGHFLERLLTQKIIISKVIEDDVKSILASKVYLLENVDEVFPGVEFLSHQAFMSASKYKKLFTKITGLSPGAFFYSNKLQRAKELLETGGLTVSEVADKLNYTNISYLAKRFNNKYGIFPKEYQSFL